MKNRISNFTQRKFPPISARKRKTAVFNKSKIFSAFGVSSAVALPVLAGAAVILPNFSPAPAYAETSNTSLSILSSVSLSATNTLISLTPSVSGDTFATGNSTVTVGCNSTAGYTLHMATEDNTNTMKYALGSNLSPDIPSITADTTGSAMPSTITGSKAAWGNTSADQTVSVVSGKQGNTADLGLTFHQIPIKTAVATIADPSSNTGSNCTSSKCVHQVGYAVKAAPDLVPGTYSRSIVFTATAKIPSITYTLNYNLNGGTSAQPAATTVSSANTTENLTVNGGTPTRDGYEFLGWADTASATTVNHANNSTINLNYDSPTKTVYAVWKQ